MTFNCRCQEHWHSAESAESDLKVCLRLRRAAYIEFNHYDRGGREKARPRCLEKQNALLENQASGDDTSDIHAAPGPYLTSPPSPLRPFLRRALRRECWPWRSCLRGRHIRRWAGRSCASEQQR